MSLFQPRLELSPLLKLIPCCECLLPAFNEIFTRHARGIWPVKRYAHARKGWKMTFVLWALHSSKALQPHEAFAGKCSFEWGCNLPTAIQLANRT